MILALCSPAWADTPEAVPVTPSKQIGVGAELGARAATLDDTGAHRIPFELSGHLRIQKGRFAYEPSLNIHSSYGLNLHDFRLSLRSRFRFGVAGSRRTALEVIVDPALETETLVVPRAFKLDWGLAVSHFINDRTVLSIQITDTILALGDKYAMQSTYGVDIGLVPMPSASLTVFIPPSAQSQHRKKQRKKNRVDEPASIKTSKASDP